MQNGHHGVQNHSTAALSLQGCAVEGRTGQCGPAELQTIVGRHRLRRLLSPKIKAAAKHRRSANLLKQRTWRTHHMARLLCWRLHVETWIAPVAGSRAAAQPRRRAGRRRRLISRPRVSRTVQDTPVARTRRTNSRSTGFGAGIPIAARGRVQRNQVHVNQRPERRCSRLPSRSARHGWSLTSRISAYSTDTRRPVASA